MPATKIRTQVKYQKISNDNGYIDAQVCGNRKCNECLEME